MKILLGSSRVAMKLLLKILLQCCLPVDGSSARRGGSAQGARRADGVGRDGAQRRARSLRSHAWHRSTAGGEAQVRTNTPAPYTHPRLQLLRVGWGCGGKEGELGACLRGEEISPRGTPRSAWVCSARAPAQVLFPPVPHFSLFGVYYASIITTKRQNSSYQLRNAAWAGTVDPIWGMGLGGDEAARLRGRRGRASLRLPGAGGETA